MKLANGWWIKNIEAEIGEIVLVVIRIRGSYDLCTSALRIHLFCS